MSPEDVQVEIDNRDAEIARLEARVTELEFSLARMTEFAAFAPLNKIEVAAVERARSVLAAGEAK